MERNSLRGLQICACITAGARRWLLVLSVAGLMIAVSGLPGCRAARQRAPRSRSAPHPPFKKLWITPVGNIDRFLTSESAVYYRTDRAYGVIDLATGAPLWQRSLPAEYSEADIACDPEKFYVCIGNRKVLACDARTGAELWHVSHKGYSSPMTAHQGLLFCRLRAGMLTALDTETGAPRWTCDISPAPADAASEAEPSVSARPLVADGNLFVGLRCGMVLCLDPETGAVRWRRQLSTRSLDFAMGFAADRRRLYLNTSANEVIALEIGSGRPAWRVEAPHYTYKAPALLGRLVAFVVEDGTIQAVNAVDGTQRWVRPIARDPEPRESAPAVYADQVFVTADSSLVTFNASGDKLWEWDTEKDLCGHRITVLNDGVMLAGQRAFLRYIMGEPPSLPTASVARRALADELVARFDRLTDDEQRTLRNLGDDAFVALLPVVQRRMRAYQAQAARARYPKDQDVTLSQTYRKFTATMEVLAGAATRKRTPELLALLREANRVDTQTPVLEWLAAEGDDRQALPVFFDMLKRKLTDWRVGDRRAGIALDAICRSRDPRAVRFLLDQLADPAADPDLRRAAFISVPTTGGEAGLRAVLTVKDRRRTIPLLAEFMRLRKLGLRPGLAPGANMPPLVIPPELLATRRDERGVLWGLIRSNVLGSEDDWWIARYDGQKWTEPLFTGGNVVAFGAVDPRTFGKDTDADGWADLVERRLGTNPNNPDTDRDGLKDSIDKNPLAAPRELSEAEQVLAAAFEALVIFDTTTSVPCLVSFPEGVEPFELSGWNWVIIAQRDGRELPLAKQVGKGTFLVSFSWPTYDFGDRATHSPSHGGPILWRKKRDQAKVAVSCTWGSLAAVEYDIHLRRFGREWVVVGTRYTMGA